MHSSCVAANGSRIGDGGAFENVIPTFTQKPNRRTNVEFITVRPTIANTMLWPVCFVRYSQMFFISFAARAPDSIAPSILAEYMEVCSPAKCIRPSGRMISGSQEVIWPGRNNEYAPSE